MDITEKILARHYAQAFLNIYMDFLKEDDYEIICSLFNFFKERRQACFLMRLSLLHADVKCKALDEIAEKFELPDCFKKLLHLLVEHKRTLLLADVFDEICNEYKKRKGMVTFQVKSVGQLSEQQKKSIEKFLTQVTQKIVLCSYKEDMNLIAGLRLQSKQYLWETSLRDRLNRVRSTLKR